MNEEDGLYEIKNYSDTDLFRMLDLTNPTDRELEAKILMEKNILLLKAGRFPCMRCGVFLLTLMVLALAS